MELDKQEVVFVLIIALLPLSTRMYTRFPRPTLFRSGLRGGVVGKQYPDPSSRRWWKGRFRLRSRLPMNPGPESGPGRGDDCSVPRGGVDLLAGLEDRVVRLAMHVEESDQALLGP